MGISQGELYVVLVIYLLLIHCYCLIIPINFYFALFYMVWVILLNFARVTSISNNRCRSGTNFPQHFDDSHGVQDADQAEWYHKGKNDCIFLLVLAD